MKILKNKILNFQGCYLKSSAERGRWTNYGHSVCHRIAQCRYKNNCQWDYTLYHFRWSEDGRKASGICLKDYAHLHRGGLLAGAFMVYDANGNPIYSDNDER